MKPIIRDRPLTSDEAAEDRRIRDLIDVEKPEIIERIRDRLSNDAENQSCVTGSEGDSTRSHEETVPPRRARADGQKVGLAGEFFVAAELLKRGFQTSVTFGNAKAIDLLAEHPATGRVFKIQVKALRSRNFFPFDPGRVDREQIYVFAILNQPGEAVEYFIVPGSTLADEPERFGKDFRDARFPGINWSQLHDFADRWGVFDQAS